MGEQITLCPLTKTVSGSEEKALMIKAFLLIALFRTFFAGPVHVAIQLLSNGQQLIGDVYHGAQERR